MDVQEDLCRPDSPKKTKDLDRTIYDFTMYPSMIMSIKVLLGTARSAGVRIYYTQSLRNGNFESPTSIYYTMKRQGKQRPEDIPLYIEEGSGGEEIVDEVAPLPGELSIRKYRASAFCGTPLDLLLRKNGIQTLVITGCETDGCIESTVRDAAYSLGYFVVLPEDCLASCSRQNHEAMMIMMKRRFDVVNSKEIIELWQARVSEVRQLR